MMKQATPNRLESVCVGGVGGYLFSFSCEKSKIKHKQTNKHFFSRLDIV